jgi:predicted permease
VNWPWRKRYNELDAEIRAHIEMSVRERQERGESAEDARAAALREFGNVGLVKETTRDTWGYASIEQLWRDAHYGLRMMRRSPAFTAVAVLTLALGIGANTAIFSAVNGILLDPLPYPDSARLVRIERSQIAWGFSAEEVTDIRQQCTALERMAAYEGSSALVRGTDLADTRDVVFVSADYFPLLGVKPLLGRTIQAQDTQPGNDRVAVLSYRLWRNFFGDDPGILGRTISVGEQRYMVIGVMPRSFDLGRGAESFAGLWAPISSTSPNSQVRRGTTNAMIARLKKGVTAGELNAQLKTISARLATARPAFQNDGGLDIITSSLKHQVFSDVKSALLILLGAVGFVLLLACVNVSALLLSRAWTRQREFAIRRALGATEFRLARQLLCESFLLSAAGGSLGLLFSLWGIRVIHLIAPPGTPRLDHVILDRRVLFFTAGVSILSAILFGLAPALQAATRRVGRALTSEFGSSFARVVSRQRHWLRTTLIISEVALALILATGGALMGRSFYKLMELDSGTQADHVLTMSVKLSDSACEKGHDTNCALTLRSILDDSRALPGVQQTAASLSSRIFNDGATVEGIRYPGESLGLGLYIEGEPKNRILSGGIRERTVTAGFFSALGMRVLRGRDFELSDLRPNTPLKTAREGYYCTPGDPRVAIVSESFARTYVPGDPIGKRFSTCMDKNGASLWTEIIGVVNDVRDHSLKKYAPTLAYYVPFSSGNSWLLVARTSSDPMAIAPSLERALQSVDKDSSITNVQTVAQIVADSAAEPRFDATLLGFFGALGLIIAMIGIYGAISYATAQRTHEIGVRMALGARRGDILRLIVGQGAMLAIIGILIGLAGAIGLTRFLRGMLFQVAPTDPATFIGVAILFVFTALLASYIPARRAMRVDPMVALRYE